MRISIGNSFAVLPNAAKSLVQRLPRSRFLDQPLSFSSLQKHLDGRLGRSIAALAVLALLFTGLWGLNPVSVGAPVPSTLPSTEKSELPAVVDERPAPSSRSAREENKERPLTFEENFIFSAVTPAQASQKETGVPASVTLAQAILESDWGRSGLSRNAKNFFGIKARPDPGPAGVVYMNTWENLGGRDVTLNEPFRAYNNMEESFVDHGRFLADKPRYQAAFKFTTDAKQFAREIHKAGYATDPGYANKLIALMDKFKLYEFDLK